MSKEVMKLVDYEPDGMHHNKPQKRPQNCGTSYCSCIECVMKPAQYSDIVSNGGFDPRTQQEPVAYDKTEMNCFVQDLYDKKMKEGKHGHYETMFHVVHQAIKRFPPQRTWVGLTDDEIYSVLENLQVMYNRPPTTDSRIIFARAIEAKLREKNYG